MILRIIYYVNNIFYKLFTFLFHKKGKCIKKGNTYWYENNLLERINGVVIYIETPTILIPKRGLENDQ